MAFQENMAMAGDGFGPVSRSRERVEPYSLNAIKENAKNVASRIIRSVESWISGSNDDMVSEMSLQFGSRGSGIAGANEASFAPTGAEAFQANFQAESPGHPGHPGLQQLQQPSPLQVEGGGLRLGGEPRGLPFRHPLEAPGAALTARAVQLEASKGLPLLRPLDEVIAKYVSDRSGGSEGMHVFNFNAKERLDFEAKIGRDLARLARSSRPGRSVFDGVTAPKPALDVWSSAPPRGFSLGGVVAPPELPPALESSASKRRKTAVTTTPALRRITEESDDVVEVAESVPPPESDVEVVEPVKSSRPAASSAKAATKRPKKMPSTSALAVEVGDEITKAPSTSADAEVEAGEEVTKVTNSGDFWRVQIEAIYRRRNPHKLSEVPGMIEKYKGKELMLYKKVCLRYDLDSSKFYADPKNWESEDKDVKDDDDGTPASAPSAPSTSGFAAGASAAPSSLFGAGSLLFDIPPTPSDPDKKINIFASSTQAEKRFASADASSGGLGSLGSEATSGLFGTHGGIFGSSSSGGTSLFASAGPAKADDAPKTKAAPAFPPFPGESPFGISDKATDATSGSLNLFGATGGEASPSTGSGSIFASSGGGNIFAFGGNSGDAIGSLFGAASTASSGTTKAEETHKAETPAFPPAFPSQLFGASLDKAPEKPSGSALFGGSLASPVSGELPGFGMPSSSSGTASASTAGSIFGSEKTLGGDVPKPLFAVGSSGSEAAGSIFGGTAPNIFARSAPSSGSLFGFTSGATGSGADAGFGRQISALSDPFGLEANAEPKNKRRAQEAPAEDIEGEALGARRKADPEVLAKRKMLRGRRSAASTTKPTLGPTPTPVPAVPEEFPPKPPGPPGLLDPPGEVTESNPFAGLTSKPAVPAAPAAPAPAAVAPAAAAPVEAASTTAAGDAPEASEPVKVDTKEDFWRVQIEAIYRRRNPMKLNDVKGLMEKHKGKEVILFKKVCKRYDLDPSKIYTNDDAWEGEDKEFKDDPDDPESTKTGSAPAAPVAPASIFGAVPASSSSTSPSIFGTPGASSGSLFGASSGGASDIFKGGNIFAAGGGVSLFGASSGSSGESTSLFGMTSGSGSIFGGSTSGNLFGGSDAGSAGSTGSTGSIFGGSGNTGSGNIFAFGAGSDAGSAGSTGSIFGGSGNTGSGNIFAFGAGGEGNKKKRRAE